MPKKFVQFLTITEEVAGKRIDNYLINLLKGVPKTHIYKILRKGEVRVNKKRIKQTYRLAIDDLVRIPPLNLDEKGLPASPSKNLVSFLASRILFEDENLIVINKPSGLSVHGGSGAKHGLIEILRSMYPKLKQLELVHRLDKPTSGCLLVAKKVSVLNELHDLFRKGLVTKIYQALTRGHWKKEALRVEALLKKCEAKGGERFVRVSDDGKQSLTIFNPLKKYKYCTFMEVMLKTGRTHQIRVHAQFMGHNVAGDEKYGDEKFNVKMRETGLTRLFLHAYFLEFTLPSTGQTISIKSPLDDDLQVFLKLLE
ncbi:RluA family pseudouridine synthase [Gammaproteobacteria bacterium]|nr:RluA family pseudouridine synthase [Gammaproteobacteria bacterium]